VILFGVDIDLPDPYIPDEGECCYHAIRVNASVSGITYPTIVWRCCFCRHDQSALPPPKGHGQHYPPERRSPIPPTVHMCKETVSPEAKKLVERQYQKAARKWPVRAVSSIGELTGLNKIEDWSN
jgi:hypothetical protein